MAQKQSQERPNIVLIMTDQQRYDSLGCYGCHAVPTPNLDRLAAEGVTFTNCYATNPICTPSRASLFTGKHIAGHGVYKLHDVLPAEEVLFSKRLQQIGCQTALFGKLHVSGRVFEAEKRHPHDGFDVYEWCLEPSLHMDSPFNGYAQWLSGEHPALFTRMKHEGRNCRHIPREAHMTHWAATRTSEYISSWDGKKPFFVMMSVFDPHNPYDGYPSEFADMVDTQHLPEPITIANESASWPEAIRREQTSSYLGSDFSPAEVMEMRKGYFAAIGLLDAEVGRVLTAIEKRGIKNQTLVIFTSDHGDMLGDHQLFVKGAFFFDPSVKVPLIVRWPGRMNAGEKCDHLVQPHDLAATVLQAAGVPRKQLASWMPDAESVIGLEQRAEGVHPYAVCCYWNSGINRNNRYFDPPINGTMLRNERYKLSIYHDVTNSRKVIGTLYDMELDPKETENLWGLAKYADVQRDLTEQVLNWMALQHLRQGGRGGDATPEAAQQVVNTL